MFKKPFRMFLVFGLIPYGMFSVTLSPGSPVNITTDGSVSSSVAVAGSTDGFLATWTDSSSNVMSSFSSTNGRTWRAPVQVGSSANSISPVAWRDSTFVVEWIQVGIGGTQDVMVSHSINKGASWSSPLKISPDPLFCGLQYPVLAQNNLGFVAAYIVAQCQEFPSHTYVNFSTDGINWPAAIHIDQIGGSWSGISLGANIQGFLLTRERGGQVYTSFSSNGTAWSSSTLNLQATNVLAGTVTVAGSDDGFMMGWVDHLDDQLYSSFSLDQGLNWSVKTLISSDKSSNPVRMASAGSDFIATWIDLEGTGWASISSDQGKTWQSPVQISAGNDVSTVSNALNLANISSQTIFTWKSIDLNAISSTSLTSGGIIEANHRSTFYPQIVPNRCGKGLFGN